MEKSLLIILAIVVFSQLLLGFFLYKTLIKFFQGNFDLIALNLFYISDKYKNFPFGDKAYRDQYKELSSKLKFLMKGEYEVVGIEKVYEDDIKHIEQLNKGESLCSICPISDEDPVYQISTKSFKNSIHAHIEAHNQGVKVKRVYIIGSETQIDKIKHELYRQANFYDVYIVNKNKPEFINIFPEGIPDFLLFNTKKASIGRVTDGKVGRTEVTSDESKINRHIHKFDTLLKHSTKIELNNKNGFG